MVAFKSENPNLSRKARRTRATVQDANSNINCSGVLSIQVALSNSAVVRSQQPALQQGRHAMKPREVLFYPLWIASCHRLAVAVAEGLQLGLARLAVRMDSIARL